MQKDDVEKLLREYRAKKARYTTLTLTADRMQRLLEAEAQNALANDALHAQQYNGMPHGKGKANKPVEDLVLRYVDGYKPENQRNWEDEVRQMMREMVELNTDIQLVDAWLDALNDRERTVVTETLINERTMQSLALASHRLFEHPLTVDSIRGIKRNALKKICEIAH